MVDTRHRRTAAIKPNDIQIGLTDHARTRLKETLKNNRSFDENVCKIHVRVVRNF